ncbi:MAG: primosomal protein N' [Bacilli bacterium]|nr:primosomal protein N' [Bacilli bacterium]
MKFAKVVVDLKNNQLNNFYDYIIPESLEDFVGIGSRVTVSFGFQTIMGYVLEINETSEVASFAKPILDCLDYEQELSKDQIDLAFYISKTMHVTLISVLELMIPSFLKGQSRKYIVIKDYNKLNPELANLFGGKMRLPVNDEIKKYFGLVKQEMKKENITLDYDYYTYGRTKKIVKYYASGGINDFRSIKRKAIYDFVAFHSGCSIDDIQSFVSCSYSLIKDMVKDETLYTKEVSNLEGTIFEEDKELKALKPYDFSYDELSNINMFLGSKNYKSFLLHSNKEDFKAAFYLEIIKDAKIKGEQVLITCPTIILQEEILMYLRRNLIGYNIFGLTSKNTKSEKYDAFMSVKYNACDCLVTTHNGIFLPFEKLGCIIVVDEENLNYNNENYPYYRACDVLDYRAKQHNAKIMYVSSSPSIYNYKRVEDGELKLLSCLANNDRLLSRRVVNMKSARLNGENEIISNYLKSRITECLKQGGQVMLLVNSKAYANTLMCEECGEILKCPKCNISLNFFKDKNIARCNYCDYKTDNYYKCNVCGGKIKPFGFGQERVSEVVSEVFEGARILNINADLMKKSDDYNKALIDIEEQKVDIIIGTNILTKSINADNIILVGLVDFDAYLLSSSHRAREMSYNYISKLSNKKEVIIQAFDVNNEILKEAMQNDYDTYYHHELENRKLLGYEPFNEVSRLTITGDYKEIYHYANYFKKAFLGYFKGENPLSYSIIGPSYSYRVKGVKLIIKHKNIDKVYEMLDKTNDAFRKSRIYVNFERYPKVM